MVKPKIKAASVIFCAVIGFLCLVGFSEQRYSEKTSESIVAVPIQLTRDSYGLALIDPGNQTLWVYEFNTRGQTFDHLRLMAARSFAYDRKLTEWNTGTPTPAQVREILEAMEKTQQDKEQRQDSKVEALEQVLEQELN